VSSERPILLGAGKTAELLLDLMEWAGARWTECRLYDDQRAGGTGPRGLAVAGGLEAGIRAALDEKAPTYVALGSKSAALRHFVRANLERRGVPLPNLIHASSVVAPSATLGGGIVLFPHCVIGPRVRLGSGVCAFSGTLIEHDSRLAENVWAGPGVVLSGFVAVGAHTFLGAGCVLSRECHVGERTLVGAGATVVTDLPDGVIAAGTPARVRGPVREGLEPPLAVDLERCASGRWAFLLT
jgi:UDP-perosamine 4-acetyltransferase